MATQAINAEQLLGKSVEDQAQVDEWLSRCSTSFAKVTFETLKELNAVLESRTLLVGAQVTLADLIVFVAVHPAVTGLSPVDLDVLCNIARWTDYVHYASCAHDLFKPVNVKKAMFAPPAELFAPVAPKDPKGPAAASKADGKAAAGKADGKATAGKADGKAASKDAKVNSKDVAKGEKAAESAAAKSSAEQKEKEASTSKDTPEKPAAAEGGKKEKKEKKEKKPKEMPTKKEEEVSVSMLDIRVGLITEVEKHPNADSLYVEKIDLGEASGPRQVVSGLVKFISEDRMKGARVLVLANVKPGNMRDVKSFGMVLCGSNEEHTQVDFVVPPEGVPVGERVTFDGIEGAPEEVLNPKKKQFEKIAPDLKTSADGVATYKGIPFNTSKGACVCTMKGAFIK
ncbi:hypothetical protein CYMTET_16795 [Cymbomonas tetramitiformis]|uniref:tRNA-binding domain-containing protein n=1 Tax=Cymbomonas tetramitiformis TaxID=36881 RepID=A0AAE0L7L5_9CHLO|nr:hypothetical protein CYMTET_16795 [Cymbomonas tetramitiformis]